MGLMFMGGAFGMGMPFSWLWIALVLLMITSKRRRFRRRMRGGGLCSYCGTSLNPAAQFCPQCGRQV